MNTNKTPSKQKDLVAGFSPVVLPQSPVASPQKNVTGSPRIVRDIVADLFNNIQKWNNIHIEGSYSTELEEQINILYIKFQNILLYVKIFENILNQICALEKLHSKDEILFISCNLNEIKKNVEIIATAYMKEYKVKEMVLENIAHSRNKDELMFLAASWCLQPYITKDVNLKLETLLVESGHRTYS